MKNFYGSLFGLVLVAMLSFGCASRTKVGVGPVMVAGQVQMFEESQGFAFDLGLKKVGVTLGYIECSIESEFGPCPEVINMSHSTGETKQVLKDVPALNGGSN